MKERHNALLAAAKLIEAVQEVGTREPGPQVGNVGRLQVFPNAPNVVPGLVKHSIELRDLSAETIARLGNEIQKRSQEIARDTGTEIIMEKVEHAPPALADPAIQAKIETAATELGLKSSTRAPQHGSSGIARKAVRSLYVWASLQRGRLRCRLPSQCGRESIVATTSQNHLLSTCGRCTRSRRCRPSCQPVWPTTPGCGTMFFRAGVRRQSQVYSRDR